MRGVSLETKTPGAASGRLPRLVGGALCLDFANTVDGHGSAAQDDYLHGYPDLLAWAAHAGIISEPTAHRLVVMADAGLHEPETVFRRAIELRETTFRIFAAIADGSTPRRADLDALRLAYAEAIAQGQLAYGPYGALGATDRGARWTWAQGEKPETILWPIVASAVELLTHGNLARLKRCEGGFGPCNWLFLDTTKAGNRRWCSMAECGGQVKSRNQAARRRQRRQGDRPVTST